MSTTIMTTSTTIPRPTPPTPPPYHNEDDGKKMIKELQKTDHMSDQRAALNQNFQFFGWGAKNYNHLNETGTNKVIIQNSCL